MSRTMTANYNTRFIDDREFRLYRNKIRRQKIVRQQQIALALIIVVLVFLEAFITTTIMADARSDDAPMEYKYYKTVEVHSGETLWSIAEANIDSDHYKDVNAYIYEINGINNLDDYSVVRVGDTLVVPYYSTEFK